MYTIEMLPARQGDALWIEYGPEEAPHRVLIDGGAPGTESVLRDRIEALPEEQRRFDLLVVTHVDSDHIAGVLGLLAEPLDGLAFDDVWFNAWDEIVLAREAIADPGILGPKQGERLSARLQSSRIPWNVAFEGGPVALRADTLELPRRRLRGGMVMTLLGPTRARLGAMHKVWAKKIREYGLTPGEAGWELEGLLGHPEDRDDPGILGEDDDGRIDVEALARTPMRRDNSKANGSSIALLAEYDGARCLLAGDAYPDDLGEALDQLPEAGGPVAIDAVKLSHHGGKKNTNENLLRRLRCRRYLVSTNGSYYDHPDRETIARVLVHGRAAGDPELVFNHRVPETEVWDDDRLQGGRYPFTAVYEAPVDLRRLAP